MSYSLTDAIRNIKDPEFDKSLEELKILTPETITIDQDKHLVSIIFTPTVAHCSMCMLIGLSIKVKLQQIVPQFTKIMIQITAGSHEDEASGLQQVISLLNSVLLSS